MKTVFVLVALFLVAGRPEPVVHTEFFPDWDRCQDRILAIKNVGYRDLLNADAIADELRCMRLEPHG